MLHVPVHDFIPCSGSADLHKRGTATSNDLQYLGVENDNLPNEPT